MENRHGLCVLFNTTPAVGALGPPVAVGKMTELLNRGVAPKTDGDNEGYRPREFVHTLREQGIVTHLARKDAPRALRARVSLAYATFQKVRKRIEEISGCAKTTGSFCTSRYLVVERTYAQGQYVVDAYNPVRMANLILGPPAQLARA